MATVFKDRTLDEKNIVVDIGFAEYGRHPDINFEGLLEAEGEFEQNATSTDLKDKYVLKVYEINSSSRSRSSWEKSWLVEPKHLGEALDQVFKEFSDPDIDYHSRQSRSKFNCEYDLDLNGKEIKK